MRGSGQSLKDLGPALLIECRDPMLALRISSDALAGKHCRLSGDHLLVVPTRSEKSFRKAVRRLGYVLPPS